MRPTEGKITLKEAIEVLQGENKYPWNRGDSPLRMAVKLGIEALAQFYVARKNNELITPNLLPSETEE